ncbi:RuBisCO large subunit C-terminal-like domain-containing protein [Halomonas sp. PAMB 3264]|uniref:RuBisCO large subunit C-terminal-like domain-containing protein n=1 Tax=Halomonas sp. PAMB 3264 TaxID=3075222 RepID=UPI00289FCD41|nr:RuBisCO large subunit C-terminal-like domain-containing protein [Halomonas sp. PAMB 3264]WNL43597.1 RuBisCO large subunit C-terminal-like domain-containing protein [Halomonas sp. PAMB 3264]
MIRATYHLETPLDPHQVADMMAGEQSCATFVRLESETDALRERFRARVTRLEVLEEREAPTLYSAYLARKNVRGPWKKVAVDIEYPEDNVGVNLPTLAATVAGNLFDLGELTGLRLMAIALTPEYRDRYPRPVLGVAGTREAVGAFERPLFGTILKPNIGMTPEETADLVERLCEAGVDFIKDDEIAGNLPHAPVEARVSAVMPRLKRYQERSGRNVMVAFNITDELDAMRRHADHVQREGGHCVMASLNWCGLSAMQTLRASTELAIHGHRNGFGAFARHPALGIDFNAYQTLYRLTGIDHMHVHGMNGKFADATEEVAQAAKLSLMPLGATDDRVMPVFSSGQWAGTLPFTVDKTQSADFMFLAGGGILAHPGGAAAGVASLKEAWQSIEAGEPLSYTHRPALAEALDFFGSR